MQPKTRREKKGSFLSPNAEKLKSEGCSTWSDKVFRIAVNGTKIMTAIADKVHQKASKVNQKVKKHHFDSRYKNFKSNFEQSSQTT